MLKKLLLSALVAGTFTAANAQTIWSEDFEGSASLPVGWSQTTLATDGGWLVGTGTALSSSSFPIADNGGNVLATNDDGCNCNKSADIISMPAIDLTAYTSLYLIHDLFYGGYTYQSITESLTMLVSVDNGITWTPVLTAPGFGDWKTRGYNISAFAGLPSVKFGLKYNDGGGWLYGAAIDNIKIVVPDNILKAKLSGVQFGRYVSAIPAILPGYTKFWAGQNMAVGGTIENSGFVPITSFDATWTRGAQSGTESFSGVNIDVFGNADFQLDVPVALGANTGNIVVTISNINGGTDNDASDNVETVNGAVQGVVPVSGRKVLVEEATGTWCQWCPRGTVMMEFIAEEYPDLAVPVAVHNGDPMKVTVYDTGMGLLIGGYPSGLVDRKFNDIDPTSFESALINRLTDAPTASVAHNVAFDVTTRVATVDTHVKFLDALNGNYQIAVIFTQDSVKGTGSTYGQVNAYSGGGNGPMGGFEDLPGTVPAAQIQYDHVARAITGSFSGTVGSVPASNPAGSEHIFTNTYTVPATYNIAKMHAISVLFDITTGEVVNAEQTDIPFTLVVGAHEAAAEILAVRISPNPAQDLATVSMRLAETNDVRLRVIDAFGKIVLENNYAQLSGDQQLSFRVGTLPAGNYMVSLTTKGHTVTQQIVVAH